MYIYIYIYIYIYRQMLKPWQMLLNNFIIFFSDRNALQLMRYEEHMAHCIRTACLLGTHTVVHEHVALPVK